MDRKELETYQVQLSQVELALAADPSNAELSSLRAELLELVELTEASVAQAEASKAESSARKPKDTGAVVQSYSAGEEVLARYSGDNNWYPARVASVGGSTENRVYSVVFKGYNTTEVLNAAALKPMPANYSAGPVAAKHKLSKAEEEERERKKKRTEKKLEVRAAKSKEQVEKQQTWQKFTKKVERKGVHIPGTTGTSIFKSPDNPHGRVGVTGSGNPMTQMTGQRTKHKFVEDNAP